MIKHGKFFGHPYLEIRMKYKGYKSYSTFMDGYAIHTIWNKDSMKKIRDFTIKEENFNESYVRSVIDSLLIITKT